MDTQGIRKKLIGAANMLEVYHRRNTVEKITGLSRSLIYEMINRGEFPRPIRIGKRAVAWRESDIAEWQSHVENNVA